MVGEVEMARQQPIVGTGLVDAGEHQCAFPADLASAR
jgi:hypothetical protein